MYKYLMRNPRQTITPFLQNRRATGPTRPFAEFHYQVAWRSTSAHPGHHRSTAAGGGYEFHGHAALISNPDPRHLDVHASLHDPFGQFMVRIFRQSSTIPVYVVADMSASMGFKGMSDKMDLLAEFAASAAHSAYRTGDPFGFMGCDSRIHWDLFLPLRFYKGIALELFHRLAAFQPQGKNAAALMEIAPHLGRQRALVFLVSDFHLPLAQLSELLNTLIHHDVVPIVLWDSLEYQAWPRWGLVRVGDPETGRARTLFMRPALYEKFQEGFARRRRELIDTCLRYGREPFFMIDRFEPDKMTRYFFSNTA